MTCLTLLGTFPVPKLPPFGVGGEEVKLALNWKWVKGLSLLPSTCMFHLPQIVKMVFVKYLLVCLLVESVPVYRTALPEPN